MIDTLIIATHNEGKRKELAAMFDGVVGDIKTAGDLGLEEPKETGTTFFENATIKALAAMKATGLPALADDSGLCVNALNGAPGVYTADWAGNPRDYMAAMQTVHEKLENSPDLSAYFTCVLALAVPGEEVRYFEGCSEGTLCWPPRGVVGFGYDPMFIPDGHDKTFAEMTASEKNRISHRTRAVQKFVEYLKGEPT